MRHLRAFSGRSRNLHRSRTLFWAAFCIVACAAWSGSPQRVFAAAATSTVQQQIDQANAQIAALQAQIAQYESTLTNLGNQKATLQNAIDSLAVQRKAVSANISVTQTKINQTSLQLTQLGGSISDKTKQIGDHQTSIAESLRAQEETEDSTLIEQILSTGGLVDAWEQVAKITTLNDALRQNITDLTSTKTSLTKDYNATQATQTQLLALRKQLAAQKTQLDQNTAQKNALLAQTNNSEATYQELLSEAKAQLASFSTFVANAGGAGLLGQETVCDSWGCYYNQRDADWGNMLLSGTRDRLAADGCLVTSMAMVMTHYGYRSVTPVVINANPGNFSAVGGLLLKTISAGGVTATRTLEQASTRTIDAILAAGEPVVVGLHAYGGTHFVVLVKDTGSDYLMRDPYIQNGKDISFSAHYSFRNIYEVNKVVINK